MKKKKYTKKDFLNDLVKDGIDISKLKNRKGCAYDLNRITFPGKFDY
jgi:hypothetical protein